MFVYKKTLKNVSVDSTKRIMRTAAQKRNLGFFYGTVGGGENGRTVIDGSRVRLIDRQS